MADPNAHFVLDILPTGEIPIADVVGVNHIENGTLKAQGWLGITQHWIGFREDPSFNPRNEIMPAAGVRTFEFTPSDARATVVFDFGASRLEFNGNAVELSELLTAFQEE